MKPTVIILIFLLPVLTYSGIATPMSSIPSFGPKTPTGDITVSIFDGTASRVFSVSKGPIRVEHDVSTGLHGVVFFTMDGFSPSVYLFKSTGAPFTADMPPLKELRDHDKGVLSGVVHSSVSGGKLAEHRGISELHGGVRLKVTNGKDVFSATTDSKGVYEVILPPGEYTVLINSSKRAGVKIEKDRTAIKNIREGIILVD